MENTKNMQKYWALTATLTLTIGLFIGWVVGGQMAGTGIVAINNATHDDEKGNHMTSEHAMQNMAHNVNSQESNDLDQEFLNNMIIHHIGAIDMATDLQKTTTRPELQKMANDIIVAQTKEIEMMQAWRKAWFK